ncbi:UNKNOWN [Stylonychia lemnae]|uniref:Uncharacterized protein n=1 Tax=Stylonychia lemnae TaxID=5949 RepID=A0A078AUP4_STYLE|nr:UNKNOWN [Stylonychia lemnae]|eukprot:CDW85736.1 UNKNOWN [Stylonychia lemnae]
MRKTTTGFQLLGSSQNPIQSPRSNSPDDILLSFDVKQIHTKKLKTLQQMKKLNRKFTSQDRMRECKTKDSSINTSNLARVQSQENSKVAQKVIPLDEYFKNSIFSKVFVSPNDNSAIRQIKLGKKNHSENQIFLRAQQKNGDSQGQNKILRIPVFGVIDHKIINLNQSQREIRNNIDDKLKEKLQATYYKSFQKTKRRLGNSRDIDIQLQNQPINQEQFSPSKMQKEEEMPEVDLIDSRLGFNPNGLKFRQANSQSQTHRSSRAKDYKLSASISSINPMIIQNIKPNFQNQTSPRDIHRKYYSKRFNAQSNLSIQKVDFASQMELDPSKLIPTKTLLQGNKINEDNLSGLLIPNGKYIYDENMKKLICNNINNSHNFTQQTFNTSIQNTPSSQQFQVQVRLKKYLEKSKHRPQFSVLKSKLQEFDSLLIDTKNAQGNRTHNTNTRQNSPQRKDSQIDKLMPLNNKLVTLINKRQSINMPNQKLQLTMTNPNSQFNYNNKLIKVLVDEETQKDSKDQQDQRRITPVMSKHSQKPQIEQLISKIDAKIPLENINQSMNREESKDCDTPDSMFTMGLDSFQSPLIGRKKGRHFNQLSSNSKKKYMSNNNNNILKPIFTERIFMKQQYQQQ